MKIAILFNTLNRGGAEKQVYLVLDKLRSKHEFVVIVLGGEGDYEMEFRSLGIPIHHFDVKGSYIRPRTMLAVGRMVTFVREQNPDILHSWLFKPNMTAGILKLFHREPRLIISERNTFFWYRKRNYLMNKLVYKLSSIIMVNTLVLKEEIVRNYPSERTRSKVRIIHNGIDTRIDPRGIPVAQEVLDIKKRNKMIIGCIGRFVEQKRYDDILDAASHLLQDRRDIHFVLVGGRGRIEHYKKETAQSPFREHVTFAGEVRDVLPYLNGFDVFLHASSAEGLPNVIMEAMLMGKPIIATNVGGTKDLIQEGVNGILIPPFRPDCIVRAVSILLDDPELRKEMSVNNRNKIMDFSIEKMVSNMDGIYGEAVAG